MVELLKRVFVQKYLVVFIKVSQHRNVYAKRGAVAVRALAFHQCGPGSIPGPGVICGFSSRHQAVKTGSPF